MSGDVPAVLAVDAGNSKTDLALVAADGQLMVSVRGAGMTGGESLQEKLALLASLISEAQRRIGTSGNPVARHIAACVANADLPEEEEELTAAIAAQGWSTTTQVLNDTFAVLRAGFAPGETAPDVSVPHGDGAQAAAAPAERYWGVAVTCGAGINCAGIGPDGRTSRFLALGEISGDWGGGEGIGKAALWHAIRDEDGRGPRTKLREGVAAHYGLPTVTDVVIGIHQCRIDETSLRELAPVVEACAADGDEIATRLVNKLADQIAILALTSMRKLGLTALPTPVILGGGLMTAGDPLLMDGIRDAITKEAPQAAIRVVDVSPIAGAALLGLDKMGATPDAQQRLTSALAITPRRAPQPG